LTGVTCGLVIGTTLGNNQVLGPNVYCLGAASTLNGTLTLDGQNDPNALFIFKVDGAFATSTFSTVNLINSASLCNVYWQINGQFDLGDNSVFRGTVVANGAINLLESSSLLGRALSRAGAVSLHNNIVTVGLQPTASIISAIGSTTFCAGADVTLSGNIDGVWSNGSSAPSITVTTAGNYFVTNTNTCGSVTSNHILVTVNPNPAANAGIDRSICLNMDTQLGATAIIGNTYSWSSVPVGFNSTVADPTVTPLVTTVYTLTETNSLTGCMNSNSVTVTVNPIKGTWTGHISTDWNTAGNWVCNTIPLPTDDVIIPLGCPNYPVLVAGSVIYCHSMELDGSLTIAPGGALTVNGNLTATGSLVIESQGSLITNGNVTGTATIQRTVPTDMAWHFLSSPVSGQPICNGVFAPTYPGTFPGNIATWDFYNWLPGECDANLHWRNLRALTGGVNNVDFPLLAFADSRGYLVSYGSGWSPTKNFIGTPNTADRSLAFYDVTNSCSWALPGNPFPSAVDWSKVTLKENLTTPYYYIWNDVTQNYEYWMDGTHFGGVKIDGNIPAEQGFFVKILPTGGLHLNIPNSARIHDNGTDTWIKDATANKLSLTIANGTKYNDVAYVMFEDNCTVGVDRKDAEKMFSMNHAAPQIYTIINNDLKACSNSLPYVNNGTTIPVGFIAPVDGTYSITAGNLSSFSSLAGLSIEDLKLNINQDLLQNPVYNFTATGNEDAGRFLLHFAGAIGIDNKDNSPINIYSNEKTVFITCTAGFRNATVTISNLLGQEIVSRNLGNQRTNQVNVNAIKGYYIVKVQDDFSVKTAKVFIN